MRSCLSESFHFVPLVSPPPLPFAQTRSSSLRTDGRSRFGCPMLMTEQADPRSQIPDLRFRIPDFRFRISDFRSQRCDVGITAVSECDREFLVDGDDVVRSLIRAQNCCVMGCWDLICQISDCRLQIADSRRCVSDRLSWMNLAGSSWSMGRMLACHISDCTWQIADLNSQRVLRRIGGFGQVPQEMPPGLSLRRRERGQCRSRVVGRKCLNS